MAHIDIIDNGGATMDRYTVIIDTKEVYTMSKKPSGPQGVNQFSHSLHDWHEYVTFLNRLLDNGETLVSFHSRSLPDEIRQAIMDRVG